MANDILRRAQSPTLTTGARGILERARAPLTTYADEEEVKRQAEERSKRIREQRLDRIRTGRLVPSGPQTLRQPTEFDAWYSGIARRYGLNPNPYDPRHSYDYKRAFEEGVRTPDASGHFPSKYKLPGHPNLVVGGVDTRTGERVQTMERPEVLAQQRRELQSFKPFQSINIPGQTPPRQDIKVSPKTKEVLRRVSESPAFKAAGRTVDIFEKLDKSVGQFAPTLIDIGGNVVGGIVGSLGAAEGGILGYFLGASKAGLEGKNPIEMLQAGLRSGDQMARENFEFGFGIGKPAVELAPVAAVAPHAFTALFGWELAKSFAAGGRAYGTELGTSGSHIKASETMLKELDRNAWQNYLGMPDEEVELFLEGRSGLPGTPFTGSGLFLHFVNFYLINKALKLEATKRLSKLEQQKITSEIKEVHSITREQLMDHYSGRPPQGEPLTPIQQQALKQASNMAGQLLKTKGPYTVETIVKQFKPTVANRLLQNWNKAFTRYNFLQTKIVSITPSGPAELNRANINLQPEFFTHFIDDFAGQIDIALKGTLPDGTRIPSKLGDTIRRVDPSQMHTVKDFVDVMNKVIKNHPHGKIVQGKVYKPAVDAAMQNNVTQMENRIMTPEFIELMLQNKQVTPKPFDVPPQQALPPGPPPQIAGPTAPVVPPRVKPVERAPKVIEPPKEPSPKAIEPRVPPIKEPFKFQDTNQEELIHTKWAEPINEAKLPLTEERPPSLRYTLEGTGDIFREVTKRPVEGAPALFDTGYVREKTNRLDNYLRLHTEETRAAEFEANPEKTTQLRTFWRRQPVETAQQNIVRELNLSLLGDHLSQVKVLLEKIKSDEFSKAPEVEAPAPSPKAQEIVTKARAGEKTLELETRPTAEEAKTALPGTLPDPNVFIRKVIRTVPEFKSNPVLVVKNIGNQKMLSFAHKQGEFAIPVSLLGIDPATLSIGDRLRLGETFLKPLTQLRKEGRFPIPKGKIVEPKPTQKEVVKEAVKEEPKAIKEVAKETGILEPNVRRILGTGAKEGTFERVSEGVYVLAKNGQDIAYIQTGNALTEIRGLIDKGFKADMIFLDIPYKTQAVVGGNRGAKYDLIEAEEFAGFLKDLVKITKNNDTPVLYMYSQAESGLKQMQKYNDDFTDNFKPIARGNYTKLTKKGLPFGFPTIKGWVPLKPEGIILASKSGKLDPAIKSIKDADLEFNLVRPKGYQTEKPKEMLRALIDMTTVEGDVVFDPFAGSGVTLEQAIEANRRAVGIEVSKEAVEKHVKPRVEKAAEKVVERAPPKQVLIEEAKKYETAEEFSSDALDRLFYHGSSVKNIKLIRERGFAKDLEKIFVAEDPITAGDVLYTGGDKLGGAKLDNVVAVIAKKGAKRIPDDTYPVFKPEDLIPMPRGINTEAEVENYLENIWNQQSAAPAGKKLVEKPTTIPTQEPTAKAVEKKPSSQLEQVRKEISELEQELRGERGMAIDKKIKLGELRLKEQKLIAEDEPITGSALAAAPSLEGPTAADPIKNIKEIESGLTDVDNLRVIESPEMVKLVKELTGQVPLVRKLRSRKLFGGAPWGLFVPSKGGIIMLNPEIFGMEGQAAKTLSHEIGHLADWLPDKLQGRLKRGNLIGSIRSITGGYMKGKFGVLENKTLKDELKNLTQYWKPFPENQVPKAFKQYRYNARELYADFISVLFNDPLTAQRIAPNFFEAFFKGLDTKPHFKEKFFELQGLLSKNPAEVLKTRKQDIRGMFETAEKKFSEVRAEDKGGIKSYWFSIKRQFVDENYGVIQKIKEAQKAGRLINPDDNPRHYLDERNYFGGIAKAFLEKFDTTRRGWHEDGLTDLDVGEYMFLRRVINEREGVANPLGFDKTTAERQLDALRDELGVEQFEKLEGYVQEYQNRFNKIVNDAVDGELYSEDIRKIVNENEAYSTFAVVDYMEKNIPASMKPVIGTFKDIANPLTATTMKGISILRATQRNIAAKKTVDFLQDNFPKEIRLAETKFDGQKRVPLEPREDGLALMVVMEKGKLTGYWVDQFIASSFRNDSLGQTNAVIKALRMANIKWFKPVFTMYNVGFQTFNFARDLTRSWKNLSYRAPTIARFPLGKKTTAKLAATLKKNTGIDIIRPRRYGISLWENLLRYWDVLPDAVRRGFGKKSQLVTRMEEEAILGITYNDVLKGADTEARQLDYLLDRYHVLRPEVKQSLLKKPHMAVLNFIGNLGDTIESLPKLAGYEYLNTLVRKGEITKKEMGHIIRKNVGSPDFLSKGTAYKYYNEIFLFSNAIKEGIRADIDVAYKNPKTRSGYWWKTTKINFIPKILMYAALLGMFGEAVKRIMRKSSEYDRTNYIVIPLGETADSGKAIYLRIPTDETGRIYGAIWWKLLSLGYGKQSLGDDVRDIVAVMAGQVPSLTPSIETSSAIVQFMAGKNPYDYWRNQNVLTDDEFRAGGMYAIKPFIRWVWQQSGGQTIASANIFDQASNQTVTEKIITKTPVLSNILNRWIKITDYGESESNKQVTEAVEKENAIERLERRQLIDKYVRVSNKENADALRKEELFQEMAKEWFAGKTVPVSDVNKLKKAFILSLELGYQDTDMNSLIFAISQDAQVALLAEQFVRMDKNEFDALFKRAQEIKVISKETAKKAIEFIRSPEFLK